MRKPYLCLGYGSMALAVLGLFLPLLPTTPFLIVAVGCFARSDPERAKRLYDHPRIGPLLTNWRDTGSISLQAKTVAVGTICLSYATVLWSTDSRFLHLTVGLLMGGIALYLITRPRPMATRQASSTEAELHGLHASQK
ncbi:YbaN family protein [Microvirga rosea]|uniref:YbaN family protein n=1 Tax=Microvirga rosea TaxID=2715425 RepID=UPI001D0B4545|nr:YbaN family protein [Microvirga rosea]MCB8821469.1 YbaN family protein [Microvirga rosea]